MIKKRCIVDDKNRRLAVILDLPTFEKIEEIVEDYLFGQIMERAAREKPIPLEEAKRRYTKLGKGKRGGCHASGAPAR